MFGETIQQGAYGKLASGAESHYEICYSFPQNVRTRDKMRARARLQLVRAHLYTDLYENLVGGQVLSYEHKFQIS